MKYLFFKNLFLRILYHAMLTLCFRIGKIRIFLLSACFPGNYYENNFI